MRKLDPELLYEQSKQRARAMLSYALSFFKWTASGAAVGGIVGAAGVVFYLTVQAVTRLRGAHPWLIFFLPLGGLVIVWIYHRANVRESRGTNLVLLSVRSKEPIPFRMAPLIFFSTAVTHLVGGSAGREGAAIQLGGSIAQNIGRLFKMNEKELHVMTMAGMSACFSALFGTPVTATVFAMEVVSVGAMYYSALVPCAAAAATAYAVSGLCGIEPERFPLSALPQTVNALTVGKIIALAALCGIVSIGFCFVLKETAHIYRKLFVNHYVRAAVGGALVLALTLIVYALTGSYPYNGAGMDGVARALAGDAPACAFLLKMLFTALTLEAGFKGGEIVPTFYIGSTLGCTLGRLFRLPTPFAASLGLVSLFCGVTNCPITSVILALELFGDRGLLWYLLCAAVSFMLSGYSGLYSSQKILYSKELPEFINATCK